LRSARLFSGPEEFSPFPSKFTGERLHIDDELVPFSEKPEIGGEILRIASSNGM
jgi:hypothetical protein